MVVGCQLRGSNGFDYEIVIFDKFVQVCDSIILSFDECSKVSSKEARQ